MIVMAGLIFNPQFSIQGGLTVTRTLDSHGGEIVDINGALLQQIKPVIMRPDAELVHTVSYDKYIHDDEGVTIPSYTTSSTTLKASASLSPTVAVNMNDYNYYVLVRALTVPKYNVTTVGKGRVEYCFAAAAYEIVEIPADSISALINPNVKIATRGIVVSSAGNSTRNVYWSSNAAIAAYNTAAYGTCQTVTAPAATASAITLKSPALIIRGHTTYLASTYFNAITDIRYQWVQDVYRAPKNDLAFDGWSLFNETMDVIACADSATHKLR